MFSNTRTNCMYSNSAARARGAICLLAGVQNSDFRLTHLFFYRFNKKSRWSEDRAAGKNWSWKECYRKHHLRKKRIYSRRIFSFSDQWDSERNSRNQRPTHYCDRHSGLFDTELTNEEIQREITNCISMVLPGPHVFLLLIPLGRFTPEEAKSVKIIQKTFGENSLMYTMVLFTRGDGLKNKTIEQCLGKTWISFDESDWSMWKQIPCVQ